MPAPPPPPPPPPGPPPPPPPSAALPQCPFEPPKLQGGAGGGGRSALLSDIQKGTRLRKVTQVNDRSAPVVDKPKASSGDLCGNAGASQSSSGVAPPVGPSLSGLFAGGFPTLRPIGRRDAAGKTSVFRSSSSASLKPLWNPPSAADSTFAPDHHRVAELQSPPHRPLAPSSSAPPSPSHSSRQLPPFPASALPTPPPAPPTGPPPPPPPQALHERPASKPPPLPSCPPPPPPSQVTKPTWLPIQHPHHSAVPHPSTPPPPPPPLNFQPPSGSPGDRSSGCFHLPSPSASYCESSRFPILRDSPQGPPPPPPPPPPPLPSSFTPSCPSNLPPPPPKVPPVPSPTMRSLPPSYPCSAPTRRPPAVPRSAGAGRLAPPPAPPARSPSTELSTRTPPPPPPPPPLPLSSLRNGHLYSLADDFESKFQFHPVEDLPPPDEFKPFPRIYPSKENRVNPKPPAIRTHLR